MVYFIFLIKKLASPPVKIMVKSPNFWANATLSPYSYYGFGQPANATLAENNMIGGVTVYADSTHFSLDNPATLKK